MKTLSALAGTLLLAAAAAADVVHDFSNLSPADRLYTTTWAANIKNRKVIDGALHGDTVKHPAHFSIDEVDLPFDRAQLLVVEMMASPGTLAMQAHANLKQPSASYIAKKLVTDGKFHHYVFDFEELPKVKFSRRLHNFRINPTTGKDGGHFAIRSIRLMPKQQHMPGVTAVVPRAPKKLEVPEFFQLFNGGKANAPTSLSVSYDDKALLIDFKSAIDNVSYRAAATERDGAVYADDCFDIAVRVTPDCYYQIAFNPAGTIFDQKVTYAAYLKEGEKKNSGHGRSDPSWNSSIEIKNQIVPGCWSGSIRIPWQDFGLTGAPKELGMNIVRCSVANAQGACGWNYSPIQSYADPDNFRRLNLADTASARVTYTRPAAVIPGSDPVRFANPDRRELTYKVEVRDLNTGKSTFFEARAAQPEQELRYQLGESRYEMLVTVSEGKNLIFFDAFSANTSTFRKDFAAACQTVRKWTAETPEAVKLKSELLAEGEKLSKNTDFAAMEDYIRRVAEGNRKVQLATLYTASLKKFQRTALPFAAAQADSADKVFHSLDADIPFFPVRPLGQLAIETAKNEIEGTQLVLIGMEKPVGDLKIRLTGEPAGKAPKIRLFGVDFLDTRSAVEPRYPVSYRGEWPEVLANRLPGKLAPYEVRSVWIQAETASDVPAGLYTYTLELSAKGLEKPLQMPLTVTVWDFALPAVPTLRTACSNQYTVLSRYYAQTRKVKFTPAQQRDFGDLLVRFLLKNRINPGNIYTQRHTGGKVVDYPDLNRLAEYGKLGLNAVPVACMSGGRWQSSNEDMLKKYYTEPLVNKLLATLKRSNELAAAQNMQHTLYIHAFDEIYAHGDKKNKIKTLAELVKKVRAAAPGIKIECISAVEPELVGLVDIWCPSIKMMVADPESYKARQKAGDELWLYTCLGAPGHVPGEPPSFVLEESAAALRLIGWICYFYRADGFLYYSIANWSRNGNNGAKPYPQSPWNMQYVNAYNGEAALIYPAEAPRLEPLSSIRFENLRDGLEDFEYFNLLADAAGKHPLTATEQTEIRSLLGMGAIVRSGADYTDDSARILAHRRKMAEWIVRLSKRPANAAAKTEKP